ncbi:hypothetical protein GUB95_17715 [Escherichia coli]|nr:hypothetical protein [Escherichia coli]
MSKPKYPFEKRLEVVNHYFTTDDGYRIISARFGVPRVLETVCLRYSPKGRQRKAPPDYKSKCTAPILLDDEME